MPQDAPGGSNPPRKEEKSILNAASTQESGVKAVISGQKPVFAASMNMTPQNVAELLCVKDQTVRNWCEEGLLVSFYIGDNPDARRKHARIALFSAVALWLERLDPPVELDAGSLVPHPGFHEAVNSWRAELRKKKNVRIRII